MALFPIFIPLAGRGVTYETVIVPWVDIPSIVATGLPVGNICTWSLAAISSAIFSNGMGT